jgi:ABC-type nitrate/sulfonate/bicarbonate transport system substrate-binding protein
LCGENAIKLKKNRRTITITIVAAVIVVLTVSAGLIVLLNSNQNTSNLENVSITDVHVAYSGILYVAENQGYFTKNGLNVTFQDYPTAEAGFVDLEKGKVDVAQSPEYSIVRAVLDNRDIQVIATIDKTYAMNLIGRKDHGIENVSDLVGKKIGLGKGTIREFYLGRFLNLNGISIQQVTIVNLPLQESANAIGNGTVDAVVVPDAVWYNQVMADLGSNGVVFPIQEGQPVFTELVCTSEYIANNPQTIIKLLTALYEAENFIFNQPDQAQAIVENRLNFTSADLAWSDHHFALSLDLPLITAMRDEAQWLINNKLTNQTQVPDFNNHIYTGALKVVKPDSVTINVGG